jgi:integrase/recombinase XerD
MSPVSSSRLDAWLAGRPVSTASAYRRDARQFMDATSAALVEAERADVQGWIDELGESGLAASTVQRKLAALSSLFAFLVAEGAREENPARRCRAPAARAHLSEKILTRGQVRRLCYIGAEAGRDRLMLRVLYALALRASDLVSIEPRDVRPASAGAPKAAGLVNLFGKGSKEATLRMEGAPWPLLWKRARETSEGEPIFGVSRQTVWRVTKRAAERAGLPEDVSPHWLRHSAISHMLDAGAAPHEVRQFARHASLETTSTYAHVRPDASPGAVLSA